MLRSLKQLRGYGIAATDGSIGDINDFLFDDRMWTLRYVVVDTGGWLPGRKVVIAPESIGRPDDRDRKLPVALDRQRIKDGPDLEFHKPVSRQHEEAISTFYGWPRYWEVYPAGMAAAPLLVGASPDLAVDRPLADDTPTGDPNLRSAREVEGYRIAATDDVFGHVADFFADDADWRIRYLLIDTRNWLPGRNVLIGLEWLTGIDWSSEQVSVNLTRDEIKESPPYDPEKPLDRDYEAQLHQHYGRPVYWY
jgi:hypothetical protein